MAMAAVDEAPTLPAPRVTMIPVSTNATAPRPPRIQTYQPPPRWQVDPDRVERIGVWCGRRLFVFDHTDPRLGCVDIAGEWPAYEQQDQDSLDLADVVRVAARAHCGAIWLVPAIGVMPGKHDPAWMRSFSLHARLAMARSAQVFQWHELSANRGTALAGLVAQRRDAAGIPRGIPIGIFATWIDAWPICGALRPIECAKERARAVATGVMLAAYTLGAQLRFSPSYTGVQLLRETLAAHTYEIPPLSVDYRDLLAPILPSPIQWRRPLMLPRQTMPPRQQTTYLHKYDRIGSYVASARVVGVGDPLPTTEYQPGLPAVYQLAAQAPSNYPLYVPGYFRVGDPGSAGEYPHRVYSAWAWEPQVRAAIAVGWHVQIHQGYYWPKTQRHDLLRPWADRVWRARLSCEAWPGVGGVIARRIVKKIGVATIGRFKQHQGHQLVPLEEARRNGWAIESRDVDVRGKLTGLVEVTADLGRTDLVQPHWWAQIVSHANEREVSAILAYAPHDTVLAYIDAFYTLTDHPELIANVQLGKFRQQATYEVAGADLGMVDGLSAAALVKWLVHNGRGREHGDSEVEARSGLGAQEREEQEEQEGITDDE